MTLLDPCIRARIALVLVAALAGACGGKSVEEVETTAAVPVEVEAATVEDLQSIIPATGTVTPAPGAELTVIAPESARIAQLPKAEGDAVNAGDLLVRFDIPTLVADVSAKRAAIAQATARVEAAKANFTRLSSLLAQGVAAPREVEDARRQQAEAEADLEQARSGVEAAQALAGRAEVHATFTGVVAKRFHNPGDLVEASASDPVLRVINPAELQIVAAVPVSTLSRVVQGRGAIVREPGRDEGVPATVLTRPVQVDAASATADVRLALTKPAGLAAGTIVNVEIVGELRRMVVVVPSAAIVEDEGEVFVMVAGADNKAHKYPVALGLSTATMTEITSGLKGGERVIVRGQDELPEGAAVAVQTK